jgi:FkbM family methyltransferase
MLLCVQLDTLVGEFNFPVPNFMKIDVDGHELNILNGAMKTLANPELTSILIECNGDKNRL